MLPCHCRTRKDIEGTTWTSQEKSVDTTGNSALILVKLPSLKVIHLNPLNPNIKIQILISYPHTFSIEVAGRIC